MNNLIRKTAAVLLVLIMVFSMAACGENGSKEEKTLTMATECTFPPYETYDGDKIVGIDVEIAEAVCEKMGYKLNIVDTAFDSIIPGIQSGKYDFGMAGMTVTEDRLEEVNFSTSYATGVQVVTVPVGSTITCIDDLFAEGANNTVAVQAGTTGELYATWDIQDEGLGTVMSFQKCTDAVQSLILGKCTCMILDNEPSKALTKDFPQLHILDEEYSVEDYAAAFSKDNPELLAEFDAALKTLIEDGTVQKIIDKYIN